MRHGPTRGNLSRQADTALAFPVLDNELVSPFAAGAFATVRLEESEGRHGRQRSRGVLALV